MSMYILHKRKTLMNKSFCGHHQYTKKKFIRLCSLYLNFCNIESNEGMNCSFFSLRAWKTSALWVDIYLSKPRLSLWRPTYFSALQININVNKTRIFRACTARYLNTTRFKCLMLKITFWNCELFTFAQRVTFYINDNLFYTITRLAILLIWGQ